MPKRSAQEKLEYYRKKIQKVEQKQRRRRITSPISSSEEEGNEDIGHAVGDVYEANQIQDQVTVPPESEQNIGVTDEHVNISIQSKDQPGPSLQDEVVPTSTALAPAPGPSDEPELDPELLSALGESISDTPDYGDHIHSSLTKLWLPLLKKGMPKESKEKMCKEYLVPDNCRLLQTPKLNAEISAAVPDMVRNRDKVLSASQQQLGVGITAINRGMDFLLKSNDKIQAMKHLSNGCRLLCDSHSLVTQNRIRLITPSLDKTFLHVIHDSERDETLFGSSLPEKIKAAKAIEKQGLQIKNKPAKPQKQPSPQTNTRPNAYQGNWSAPPRYPANRGGRGGFKKPFQSTPAAARRPYNAPQQRAPPAQHDKPRAPAHQ